MRINKINDIPNAVPCSRAVTVAYPVPLLKFFFTKNLSCLCVWGMGLPKEFNPLVASPFVECVWGCYNVPFIVFTGHQETPSKSLVPGMPLFTSVGNTNPFVMAIIYQPHENNSSCLSLLAHWWWPDGKNNFQWNGKVLCFCWQSVLFHLGNQDFYLGTLILQK